MTTPVLKFASVAEAVAHFHAQGFKTVLENAGHSKCRLMMKHGDIMVIRHMGLLDVEAHEDDGFWQDKLTDWASDGAEFL
jgi:hypothetical protein